LGELDTSPADASLKDGVLNLGIPTMEEAQAKPGRTEERVGWRCGETRQLAAEGHPARELACKMAADRGAPRESGCPEQG
jgi:hypothetical protein